VVGRVGDKTIHKTGSGQREEDFGKEKRREPTGVFNDQ
jgi:hypothetical protein